MERTTITVGERPLTVVLARTSDEWAQGLVGQGRDCDGLLMVMPRNTRARFHMRQVPDPVLLALFDADGTLVDVALMEPETGAHTSRTSFTWALELVGPHAGAEGILDILGDLKVGLRL